MRTGREPSFTEEELVRHEERLVPDVETTDAGHVRFRKEIDRTPVEETFTSGSEDARVERVAPEEGDSGQVVTLPDGSISIPLFEERLVVEKKLFVKERVIIRKQVTIEEHTVEAELGRERLVVEADPSVAHRVEDSRAKASEASTAVSVPIPER